MFPSSTLIGRFGADAPLQVPGLHRSDTHVTGTDDLTCRKHTHKTTYHMQSRYGFDFALSGSVIVSFFVGVDFYLSV